MAMQRNHEVGVGQEVHTSDGDKIGSVKEVGDGFFKVDAKMQTDYWLQTQFVASSDGDRVVMNFHKDNLGDYKVTDPGEYVTAVAEDVVASDRPGTHPQNPASATIDAAERRAQ